MLVEKMFARARECHTSFRLGGEWEKSKDRKHAQCLYSVERFVDKILPADGATIHILAIGRPQFLVPEHQLVGDDLHNPDQCLRPFRVVVRARAGDAIGDVYNPLWRRPEAGIDVGNKDPLLVMFSMKSDARGTSDSPPCRATRGMIARYCETCSELDRYLGALRWRQEGPGALN